MWKNKEDIMKRTTSRQKLYTGLFVLLMALGMALTGCGKGGENQLPQNTSIVVGAHDLFPKISFRTEAIYSRIYDSCYSWGSVSGVVSDGNAFMACDFQIREPDKRIDESKRKQIASSNADQIIEALSKARAKTPEIDTLSAISLSARDLQSVTGECKKTLLIFDSGLSTASLLDFSSQNLIAEPVENIVAQLKELHAIPELSGIDEIIWVGLGYTCGEQQPLTEDYRYRLQEIWKGILTAGGAGEERITFDPMPVTGDGYEDVPVCSTVPVVTNALELTGASELPEAIVWDGDSICFEANSAVFLDEPAVLEKMKPVADYLMKDATRIAYLFGTTATTNTGDLGLGLSEERADACRALLLRMGVQEQQVIAIGLGQLEHPLRVRDVDREGRQIEAMAKKNRSVIFVRSDSSLAKLLISKADPADLPAI